MTIKVKSISTNPPQPQVAVQPEMKRKTLTIEEAAALVRERHDDLLRKLAQAK